MKVISKAALNAWSATRRHAASSTFRVPPPPTFSFAHHHRHQHRDLTRFSSLRGYATQPPLPVAEEFDTSFEPTPEQLQNEELLAAEEAEDAALRAELREKMRSVEGEWREPVAVWRDEDTGEVKFLEDKVGMEGEDVPWFVDEEDRTPTTPSDEPAPDAILADSHSPPLPPPPAPASLPVHLEPLYEHLVQSPFFDTQSVRFIDTKGEPKGMGGEAWVDWVAVVSLKRGREGGIAGAVEAVRVALVAALPKTSRVYIEGLQHNPQTPWAMLDAGSVLVHVLTEDAREALILKGCGLVRGYMVVRSRGVGSGMIGR